MAAGHYVRKLFDSLTWQNDWASEQDQAGVSSVATLAVAEDQRAATLKSLGAMRRLVADGKSDPVIVRDIAHCGTHGDALREIAIYNVGVVRLTEAAALIKDAGMTSTTKGSVRSNLHRLVTQSEDWVFIGRGKAWLLEFGPVPDGLADLDVSVSII